MKIRNAVRARRALVPALSCAGVLSVLGVANAQQVVVSMSGATTVASGAVEDEELLVVDPSGAPRKFLSNATLSLYFGDRNHDGFFDVPNDIDALAFLPHVPGQPMIRSAVFSLLTDQNGIKDGDIVRFDPSDPVDGLDVMFPESVLITAIGATDGNIDVDAIAFGPDGSLYFSLAEDETVGPNLVVMQDETVFVLPPGAGTANVYFTATQMEAFAQHALNITSAIGDVMSLEYLDGDLLFTVQSPSASDATILSTKNGGEIWNGYKESALGLGANAELDALAFYSGPKFASLDAEPQAPAPAAPIDLAVDGLTPSQPFLLVLSGTIAPNGSGVGAPGFSALVASPFDPLFLLAASNAPALVGIADAAGVAHFPAIAPLTGGLQFDVAVQAYDGGNGRFSAPVVVELAP